MTIDEALAIAQFLTRLAMELRTAAQATPAGLDVDLDALFVRSTTQKLKDAGIDPAEADRLEKKDAPNGT